jgi:putative transposase
MSIARDNNLTLTGGLNFQESIRAIPTWTRQFSVEVRWPSDSPPSARPKRQRRPVQLELPMRTWGGKRAGAGRKPASGRAGVPHRARPMHSKRHPIHVTMRAERRVPNLRRQGLFAELRRDFGRASRASFRVVHFSVQSNHVHLLVEANDRASLSRGIAGLAIRLARSINRVLSRRGQVWGDRYHARALRTAREVRHALVYVLMNFKKHGGVATHRVDAMSSAAWFDGWKPSPRGRDPTGSRWGAPCHLAENDAAPVWRPRTWLARKGWRRHGRIGQDEHPGLAPTTVRRTLR